MSASACTVVVPMLVILAPLCARHKIPCSARPSGPPLEPTRTVLCGRYAVHRTHSLLPLRFRLNNTPVNTDVLPPFSLPQLCGIAALVSALALAEEDYLNVLFLFLSFISLCAGARLAGKWARCRTRVGDYRILWDPEHGGGYEPHCERTRGARYRRTRPCCERPPVSPGVPLPPILPFRIIPWLQTD
ncbi:hypothetical protein C8F04DRAFT_259044 [Mycena alexandri]|uniref:Uncharacterized protein n=1 Tax=Mycena alexandri TaxID=1745969 RepID=A0AAD6WQV3_9AGAR|nr:hypothetical protein C8F04DRAFT_259044 [Mycena alexandri]